MSQYFLPAGSASEGIVLPLRTSTKIVDDPARSWVRDSWQNQEIDPRLTDKE